MLAQEKTCRHQSNSVLSSENTASMDVCVQLVMEEDQVPKIRKPYTITKQRERWTDEEHERFLEALKLHGRAWRKIEDHIGTKTAVQIRSHAQKFFSKVVRETSNSNAGSTEPIEIPPPRPKRKPSHPYPRKLVLPAKKENPMNHHARSTSTSSSIYEQQNGSPTSVLPDLASDTQASAYLAAPDVSPSPLSSNEDVSQAETVPSDDNVPEDNVQAPQSVPNDRISVKLELFPGNESVDKPESVATTKVLKLFGKDVVVPSEPFDSSLCLSKSPSSDMGEELLQASQPMDIAVQSAEIPWDCQTLYYVDGNGNQVEKPIPLPWWVFFRGIAVPSFQCQFQTPREKESQREGSSACSSSESVNAVGSSDNNWDAESKVESDMEKRQTLLGGRSNTSKANKGFVPYKRCFSERDAQSSKELNINEEEGRRIRLCL